MVAGRRIKTVASVAILAVTIFGALATASAQQQAFPTAETQQSLAKAPRPAAAPPGARYCVLGVQPAAVWPLAARAQQRATPVIGLLSPRSPVTDAPLIALFQ